MIKEQLQEAELPLQLPFQLHPKSRQARDHDIHGENVMEKLVI